MDKYEEAIAKLCRFLDTNVYSPIQEYIKSLILELEHRGFEPDGYDFGYRKERLKGLIETVINKLKEET